MTCPVRRLGPADAARLERLLCWRRSGKPNSGEVEWSRPSPEFLAIVEAHLAEPTLYMWAAVAEHDPSGALLGYISVARIIKPDPRQYFYVDELWVPEPYRRRGIASALLQVMLAEARCRSMWRVRLQAAATPAARALYIKAGFQVEPGGWAEHTLA